MARRRVDEKQAEQALTGAMRDAGLEEPAHPEDADSPVNGPMPRMGKGFSRIEETVFNLPDPMAEYDRLEKALELGPSRGTEAFVKASLDKAERNALAAYQLYVNSKVDLERFTRDADLVESALWAQATRELQTEKDAGMRSKQITDKDVTLKVTMLHPDTWADLQERRTKASKTVDLLEQLADLWRSRCRSLASILGKSS